MGETTSPTISYIEKLVAEASCGPAPGPVASLKAGALQTLQAVGFPTPADEEWKYTNTAPVVRAELMPAAPADCSTSKPHDLPFADQDWLRIVVLNGRFCPELSEHLGEHGIVCSTIDEAAASGQPLVGDLLGKLARPAANGFAAQNAAFFDGGLYVRVPKGRVVALPLHVSFIFTATEAACFPRVLIVAEEGSVATVVEMFGSSGASRYLTNHVSEVAVGENANLTLVRLQEESTEAYHISNTQVSQATGSAFSCATVSLGGALVRNDLASVLSGEHCECDLNGLSVLDGSRHVDNHTLIDHASPNCASHELYKAVLDDNSRSVFNGKVIVRPDAQKTDARQTNRNLLLSTDARVDTKPQLEIFADDVKCTHGATIGQLDDQQLFYLRSRGIGEEVAKQLLTFGFAYDIVQRIKLDAVRGYLDSVLVNALHTSEEFQTIHDNLRT